MPTQGWVEWAISGLPALKHPFLGNEVWKYLFSLIYIFLAFYVSKVLDYLTRVWLKRWAEKTETKFDDLILDLLNGPVKIVSFVVFLRIGLGVFGESVRHRGFVRPGRGGRPARCAGPPVQGHRYRPLAFHEHVAELGAA